MLSCHVDIFNTYIVKYANFSYMDCGFTIFLGQFPPTQSYMYFTIFSILNIRSLLQMEPNLIVSQVGN